MSEEKLIEGERLNVEYELPIDTQLTIHVKRKVSDRELKIIDSAVKIINTLEALSYNLNIDYSLDQLVCMTHPGGAPRKFKTPEDLETAFEDYKSWAHENPWLKKHPLKDGTIIDISHERPLTMFEFAAFCGLSMQGLDNYGKREDHKQFFGIYARIKTEITAFQVSGGLCDIYNPSLTARINGISDKSEQDIKHTVSGVKLKFGE